MGGVDVWCGVLGWSRSVEVRTLYYDRVCGGEGGLLLTCWPYTK